MEKKRKTTTSIFAMSRYQDRSYKRYTVNLRLIGVAKDPNHPRYVPDEERSEENDIELIKYINKCKANGENTTSIFRRAMHALLREEGEE